MNLLKYFSISSFIVFFSRILGFIRDSLIAYYFGVSYLTDSFFVAFKLPNFFRCIFSENVFSQIFIQILGKYKKNGEKLFVKNFISLFSGFSIFFLFVFIVFGIFFSSSIVNFISPGFIKKKSYFDLSVCILKILFPYILLIFLVSFYNSILNIWNCFYVSSFTSILLNLTIIFSIFFLREYFSIKCLVFGFLFGGIFQLLYQFFFLKKIDMLIFPRIFFDYRNIIILIKPVFPFVFIVFLNQVSLIFNTIFVSFLDSGMFSYFYYADRLVELPIGIFGVTLSSILLPILTENFLKKDKKKFQYLIDSSLRICFLLGFPCTIGLIVLSKFLVVSFFQYGNFTIYDTRITQNILIFYSFGLLGSIMTKVLSSCFYSFKDVKTPLRISCFVLFFTQLMNFIFFKIFKYVSFPLLISFGYYANAFFLYRVLLVNSIFTPIGNWRKFFIELVLSSFLMILVLLFCVYYFPILDNQSMFVRMTNLFFIVFFSIFSYFLGLFFFGFRYKDFFKQF